MKIVSWTENSKKYLTLRNYPGTNLVEFLEKMHKVLKSLHNMLFNFALLAFICVSASVVSASVRPRKEAPLFKAKAVLNDKFIDVSLKQYSTEGKWSVLLFYPFDYTFVCPVSWFLFCNAYLFFPLVDWNHFFQWTQRRLWSYQYSSVGNLNWFSSHPLGLV